MADSSFDLVVVGAGPGGYVAAIRAAQLGLRTALVEKRKTLGGTCLNVGCIPSKALLHSTEMFAFVRDHGREHGLGVSDLALDLDALLQKKDAVVKKLVGGVGQLVSKRGIEVVTGTASFVDRNTLEVSGGEGSRTIRGSRIVVATGSRSVELPFLKFDGQRIVSSDEAIAFPEVPKKLVVVGGGAIGLELGSVWARLGSEVDVVEFLPRIAPTFDEDVSRLVERILKKQGMRFHTGTKVTGAKKAGDGVRLTAEKDGSSLEFEADRVLVAVGRAPNTEGLGLDAIGLETDDKGRIPVNGRFETSVEGVYAIGDVIAGPMLAHKAEEEGVALAEMLAGQAGHVNYDVIPNVIYTDPEIASVGLTEGACRERKIAFRVGSFSLAANGRALAMDATQGMVKVVADEKTDRLLGIQIVARGASEIIASAVAHMEYGGSAEDLARTVHAHPTISEAVKEAALAVDGRALHAL